MKNKQSTLCPLGTKLVQSLRCQEKSCSKWGVVRIHGMLRKDKFFSDVIGIWNDLSTNEQETVMSMLRGLRK